MPQFSLPNIQTGGSQTIQANTLQDAMNQASSAGTWNPGAGTYGANSSPGGGGGGGGGGGDALSQFAAQTSGVTQKQLDQQKAEFNAQLQFAQNQMQQLGIPQLQINQFLAQLQQQQFQSGLALAQQAQAYQQAATTAGLTGYYTAPAGVPDVSQWTTGTGGLNLANPLGAAAGGGGAAAKPADGTFVKDANGPGIGIMKNGVLQTFPTWDAYIAAGGDPAWQKLPTVPSAQFQALQTPAPAAPAAPAAQPQMTMQLGQLLGQFNGQPTEAAREFNANLGQQYLATAAQLQGPQNTFQLSNYLRGAQANQNVPQYLQNLAQGIGQNLFNAPGATPPTPQSAAGLASQLGGTSSATPGWDYNQTLGTIQNIMNAGAGKLGPGALENLTPDELQALGSGIGAAGGTLPSFLQQYAQSRIGQNAPVAQTALA